MDIKVINQHLPHGRDGLKPTVILTHAMGEFIEHNGIAYPAVDWLDLCGLSAHALIQPNGEIIRCRDDNEVAWHGKAGGYNFKALGAEFIVPGIFSSATPHLFLEAMKTDYVMELAYNAGLHLYRGWMEKHPITEITRHSETDPDNKQDPGAGFPWHQFLSDL